MGFLCGGLNACSGPGGNGLEFSYKQPQNWMETCVAAHVEPIHQMVYLGDNQNEQRQLIKTA